MRNLKWDQPKGLSQLKKEQGKICSVPGCNNTLTHMQGPGSGVLCRDHQVEQREYGGLGRYDRPHTFHRKWFCDDCGTNVLEDPRLADVEDEMIKRRIARILMHGDHQQRHADGGDDTKENVRSRCYVCHAKKTVLHEDYKK
jgi:hypothetical protein